MHGHPSIEKSFCSLAVNMDVTSSSEYRCAAALHGYKLENYGESYNK